MWAVSLQSLLTIGCGDILVVVKPVTCSSAENDQQIVVILHSVIVVVKTDIAD